MSKQCASKIFFRVYPPPSEVKNPTNQARHYSMHLQPSLIVLGGIFLGEGRQKSFSFSNPAFF